MGAALPFLILVNMAALSMSSAKANTVDPASYSIQFQEVPGAVDVSGTSPQSGSYNYHGGTFDVNASATTASQPSVSVDLTSGGCTSGFPGSGCASSNYYSVTSEIDYYLEVSGPAGATVPYYFLLNGGQTVTGGSAGTVLLVKLTNPYGIIEFEASPVFNGGFYCSSATSCLYISSQYLELLTNTQYKLEIQAQAQAETNSSSMATGWADAYIYIDPAFAGGGNFSLLISPGVDNSPNVNIPIVPEPSTWAMMLLGFAGLGFAGYRASRRGVSKAA
jgi:PEP-CTERM motif